MDPNHAHHAVGVDPSYDNSVTSSGYPPDLVTPSGYPDNTYAQNPDAYAQNPDNAYGENPATYPHDSVAAQHPAVDIAALMASNAELVEQVNRMRLGYNTEAQRDAVQAQRDAACAEAQTLASQMAATIARLERLESASKAQPVHERTRDPRVRPTPSKATSSNAPPAHAQPAAKPTATKEPPATPKPASDTRRRSKTPNDSQPNPSPKPSRPSPQTSRASSSTNPPRSSPKPSDSSANGARKSPQTSRTSSSTNPPRSSPKPLGSSANGARKSSGSASPPSASSSKGKNGTKQGTPRKLAEHQMLEGDIDIQAQSFKTTFQTHIRFLTGSLDSTSTPPSATPAVVEQFGLRFEGLTVTELRRTGQIGSPLIDPSKVKVGISVEDSIRSKNQIVRAFFQLEESALLHVKAYLAKLGITVWAVDFRQSPWSMYNTAMRMCAIDTFRYLLTGTYYDFLHPDTRYIKDSGLMWKLEIRAEGSNRLNAERNKASQARGRLYGTRHAYLTDTKAPKRLQLLFAPKATSDDESTPLGPQALAREERSEAADRVIRKVDRLIIEDLRADGKTRATNNRERRRAPPFGQRNSGNFQEVPKEMPIQYYKPDWFNERPPQARAKLAAKLIVVFAPDTQDFFSCRGDNLLSQQELTEKFGAAVFADYDLDFGTADAEASGEGAGEGVDANDEGEGDSVGSEDSDDEAETSDPGSVASFIVENGGSDGEQDDEQDDAMDGDDAASGEEQGGDQDGAWDGQEAFAAEYDINMTDEIFGDGNDTD
ncbi:hypothetical protein C8R44DRAFT_883129 [Mycena epipterygia]|nr:hypothetical protein C8R44DRAFT_883129 [Mycena epipterygia]